MRPLLFRISFLSCSSSASVSSAQSSEDLDTSCNPSPFIPRFRFFVDERSFQTSNLQLKASNESVLGIFVDLGLVAYVLGSISVAKCR